MVLKSSIRIPNQPILVAGLNSCKWLSFGCKVETIDLEVARNRISRNVIPIVCHAPTAARRLQTAPFPALDVLELFAFVHPTKFLLPTPIGIAEALGLTLPNSLESAAASLAESVRALLDQLHEMRSVNEANVMRLRDQTLEVIELRELVFLHSQKSPDQTLKYLSCVSSC